MAKIKSIEFLGSSQMSNQQRLDWLLGTAFESQLQDLRLAVKGDKEAEEALQDLIKLRDATFAERRARIMRNTAIVVSLLATIGVFAALSVGTGGGFTLVGFAAVLATYKAAAIGAFFASVAIPTIIQYIPGMFGKFSSWFKNKRANDVVDAISKINEKKLQKDNNNSPQEKKISDRHLELELVAERTLVASKIQSWWSSTRNNAIGDAIAKFANNLPDGAKEYDLKASAARRTIPKSFNNFTELQQHLANLSDKQITDWLMGDEFTKQLPKMKQQAVNNVEADKLLNNLQDLRSAYKTRNTASRYMLLAVGIGALAATAIALDLTGGAGVVSGTAFATIGALHITPLLAAGGVVGILSPMAFIRSISLYRKSGAIIADTKAQIKNKAISVRTEITTVNEAKQWLFSKSKENLTADIVKMAVAGIAIEIKAPSSGAVLRPSQLFNKKQNERINRFPAMEKLFAETEQQQKSKLQATKIEASNSKQLTSEDPFLAHMKAKNAERKVDKKGNQTNTPPKDTNF